MSRLLENAGQPAARIGVCTFCEQEFPRSVLGWSGGRTACQDCRDQHQREEEALRLQKAAEFETERPVHCVNAIETGVDQAFKFGGFTARWGAYGAGCYLATQYDAVSHMLHGLVLADLGTWLATSWIDIRAHRWPVLIELCGFIALSQVMLHTDYLDVPKDPASIGLAFLAFTAFFTMKGSLALMQRIHNPDD